MIWKFEGVTVRDNGMEVIQKMLCKVILLPFNETINCKNDSQRMVFTFKRFESLYGKVKESYVGYK